MTSQDLELVLSWRNHEQVRRYMYTQQEISFTEHSRWFHNATKDTNRTLLIFEIDSVPLGFINIRRVTLGRVAEWGFYAAPYAPKGTGKQLGRAVLKYVFAEQKLHKISGEALSYNQRSINFHLRLGFQQEGLLRDHHFDGRNYHDIICFGMLACEWQTNL